MTDQNFDPFSCLAFFINSKLSICWVTFFFFCSGFGLVYSLKTKRNYLRGSFLIKIVYLFLIALFYQVVVKFLSFLFIDENPDFGKLLVVKDLFSLNWFVYELCVCYLLFFLCYKFLKQRALSVLMFMCAACWGKHAVFQFWHELDC